MMVHLGAENFVVSSVTKINALTADRKLLRIYASECVRCSVGQGLSVSNWKLQSFRVVVSSWSVNRRSFMLALGLGGSPLGGTSRAVASGQSGYGPALRSSVTGSNLTETVSCADTVYAGPSQSSARRLKRSPENGLDCRGRSM
jgi:hypothetical protein